LGKRWGEGEEEGKERVALGVKRGEKKKRVKEIQNFPKEFNKKKTTLEDFFLL